jgi:hypothetical protein
LRVEPTKANPVRDGRLPLASRRQYAFRTELAKGFNPKDVTAAMVKRGLILPGKDKNSQVLRMGRHGTMRVYVLKPGIINVPEPERPTIRDWIAREMNEPARPDGLAGR